MPVDWQSPGHFPNIYLFVPFDGIDASVLCVCTLCGERRC